MKKSTLAQLFATIFAVSCMTGLNAQEHDGERQIKIQKFHTIDHDVHIDGEVNKIIKVKLNHEQGEPIDVELDINGEPHVFTFTEDEINDSDLLEQRLADLDEESKEHLINLLTNLNIGEPHLQVHLDDDIEKQVFVFKTDGEQPNFKFNFGKTGDSVKVIEKLLEHSELTPEQLDELQQIINSKR